MYTIVYPDFESLCHLSLTFSFQALASRRAPSTAVTYAAALVWQMM